MIAKPVVKNKFWIVENGGERVATIQAHPNGVVLVVHGGGREKFPSLKVLSDKYNIKVSRSLEKKAPVEKCIKDYPIDGKSFNEVYDVRRHLPFYTKRLHSKSFYCAGYYLVKIGRKWSTQFCPKAITLKRYQYQGPFVSESEALANLSKTALSPLNA